MGIAGGSVQITGLNEAVRGLEKMSVEVDDLKKVFGEIAKEAAELASGFAPKKTGRLSGSIRGNKAKNKAVVTAGRSVVPYAGAINYGWGAHNIAPAGFMQKADQAIAPGLDDRIERELGRLIREAGL